MSKRIRVVQTYMTGTPHTMGNEQTLAKASALMSEYLIRHLPAPRGGRLLGVPSARDIKLIEPFAEVDPSAPVRTSVPDGEPPSMHARGR